MCRIEGTPAVVSCNTTTLAIKVQLDPTATVTTKEVIRHLESTHFPARTRRKLHTITPLGGEDKGAVCRFIGSRWDHRWELDLMDAVRGLFEEKEPQLCA